MCAQSHALSRYLVLAFSTDDTFANAKARSRIPPVWMAQQLPHTQQVQGYVDVMFVYKIELFTTRFRVWDGRIAAVPNFVLNNLMIFNYRRSERITAKLTLSFDVTTPVSKIDELEKRYRSFLLAHPNDFDEADSGMFILVGVVLPLCAHGPK